LEFAKSAGADMTVNVRNYTDDEFLVQLKSNKSFSTITHAFECSGNEKAINLAIKALCPNGKLLCIGRGSKDNLNIQLNLASKKEIDIIGSFRYRNSYKKALELVESGQVTVRDMITHIVDIKDI